MKDEYEIEQTKTQIIDYINYLRYYSKDDKRRKETKDEIIKLVNKL